MTGVPGGLEGEGNNEWSCRLYWCLTRGCAPPPFSAVFSSATAYGNPNSATQQAGAVNEIQDLDIPGCTGSNVSGNIRTRSHLGITPFSLQTLAKSRSLVQSLPPPSDRSMIPILPPVPRWVHLVFTHIRRHQLRLVKPGRAPFDSSP